MAQVITTPDATTRQVSGYGPNSESILAVLVKRTYRISGDGRCAAAPQQSALVEAPEADPEAPALLVHDLDLFPWKPVTDVVIKGHAYGRGRRTFEASLSVSGKPAKRILVVGDREFAVSRAGKVFFSTPAAADEVPLRYTHAYGGRDPVADRKYENPVPQMLGPAVEDVDVPATSLFLYPRNPAGRGYLVEATAGTGDHARMPNLEDPDDPLAPDRFIVGHPLAWARMPLPQATDWINYDWFPRISYLGAAPRSLPSSGQIAEVACGFAPANVLVERIPTRDDALRLTCGASLGLQLPHLNGAETIDLTNMHAKEEKLSIRLPGERPKISVDGRKGTLKETTPVIHTLVIEPDEGRLTVLWRGAANALRQYHPEELEKMPFKVEW